MTRNGRITTELQVSDGNSVVAQLRRRLGELGDHHRKRLVRKRAGPGVLMRIDSHDRFDDVADFDPATGRVEELSRQDRSAMSSQCPSGHYSRLSGTLTVFYRVDGALWLRVGNEARNVDDPSCEVRWHHEDGSSTLEVVSEGDVVTSVKYRPEPGGGPTDPTPFAEREHFDFGLFVTNVLSDEGRRARIYATPKPPVRGSSPASGSG